MFFLSLQCENLGGSPKAKLRKTWGAPAVFNSQVENFQQFVNCRSDFPPQVLVPEEVLLW